MRSLGIKFLAVVCLAVVASPVFAQSASQPAEADIVIDIRMPKILSSKLGTTLGMEEKLKAVQPEKGSSPGDIVRVFGGIASPEDASVLESIKDGKGKMEFFANFEMVSSDAADKMLAGTKKDDWTVVEKNGKSYHQPPEGSGMPAGTMMYKSGDKTVAWGTPGFAYQDSKKPFTAGLAKAWGAIPDHAIRVSVDSKSAGGFLKSLAEKGANPTLAGLMQMMEKTDSMNLSIDFSSENLISLTGAASDQESAKEIKNVMETMVMMGQMAGGGMVEQIKQQDEDAAKIVSKIIKGMNVSADNGNGITFSIPRPEGMEDVLKKAADQFGPLMQQMMGAGVPKQ